MSGDQIDRSFHSADPDVRRRAVHEMSLRPAGTPLGQILEALSDDDWRVRREAISLAAQTHEKDSLVDALLDRVVRTDNIGLRNAAIEVLGMVGQGHAEKFCRACAEAVSGGRKFLVEAMGKTEDPRMIDSLEKLLCQSDSNTAGASVEALVRIGGSRVEGLLRNSLPASDLFLRIAIVEGLTRLGTRVPWEELKPAVDDAVVRRTAAELLGRTGHAEALEYLLDLATDASSRTSSAALRAIAELVARHVSGREELIERISASTESFRRALHDSLLHADSTTRHGAAYLCALCRDESSVEAVIQAVADDVAGPDAVEALRDWGPELIEPLLMLRRGEARVWAVALELAAELSDRHAERVPPAIRDRIRSLIERDLMDGPEEVRAAAAQSLRWWGDPRDCRALAECLESSAHVVRAAATSTLEALASRVPDAVETALADADLDGPGGADVAHVLSRLGSEGAVELLKRGLHSSRARTRRAVVQALAMANATDVAELVGYAIADEDIDVQIAAVRTLGQMSTREADTPLVTALDSPFAPIRAEAALALGRRKSDSAIRRIRDLLDDEAPVVVAAALDALTWLRDDEIEAVIESALAYPDDEVFQAGLRAAITLRGDDAERLIAKGLDHPSWNVRMLAIKLLLELDTPGTRRLLTNALSDETDAMVRHAIESGLQPRS